MAQNFVFISLDGMTDPLGQSQVIPYLKGLRLLGHVITIVSVEKKQNFEKNQQQVKQLLMQSSITWQYCFYENSLPLVSQRNNLFKLSNLVEQTIVKQNGNTILHCRSYMAALIGLKLKKKYNTKFIFDMRGFWADERIDGGIWKLNNPIQKLLYKYFKRKEIEFLKKADYIISLTENAKSEMQSWPALQNLNLPIQVIPCCADLSHFSRSSLDEKLCNEQKAKLNINEKDFVISYLGSIGTWYMLNEMLDFFKCLLVKKHNAKFLFITPDPPAEILKAAKMRGIDISKLIIVCANRNEVPMYLSLSVVSIYFIKPLYSKKASSPTKTGEIMAMGIPIITNTGIGDSDAILNESKAGVIINEFTALEYNRIIDQIDVLLKTEKKQIIDAANDYFSLENGVSLYASVYDKILSKK